MKMDTTNECMHCNVIWSDIVKQTNDNDDETFFDEHVDEQKQMSSSLSSFDFLSFLNGVLF